MIKHSCENNKTWYLCWFGKRYVFYEGKYVGWYDPNLNEVLDK